MCGQKELPLNKYYNIYDNKIEHTISKEFDDNYNDNYNDDILIQLAIMYIIFCYANRPSDYSCPKNMYNVICCKHKQFTNFLRKALEKFFREKEGIVYQYKLLEYIRCIIPLVCQKEHIIKTIKFIDSFFVIHKIEDQIKRVFPSNSNNSNKFNDNSFYQNKFQQIADIMLDGEIFSGLETKI